MVVSLSLFFISVWRPLVQWEKQDHTDECTCVFVSVCIYIVFLKKTDLLVVNRLKFCLAVNRRRGPSDRRWMEEIGSYVNSVTGSASRRVCAHLNDNGFAMFGPSTRFDLCVRHCDRVVILPSSLVHLHSCCPA